MKKSSSIILVTAVAVTAVAVYLGIHIGAGDVACHDPGASVSCAEATTQARTPLTTVFQSMQVVTSTSASPTTIGRTSAPPPTTTWTAPKPPAAPSQAPASVTTSRRTTTVPPPPVPTTSKPVVITTTTPTQPALVKKGTLDTAKPAAVCPSGGIQVSLDHSPPARSNGLTFRLVSSGTNHSPELQIAGISDYTFAEIRVVTDAGNPFVGHPQSMSTAIPQGTGNVSYDVLASNLAGVVVCM